MKLFLETTQYGHSLKLIVFSTIFILLISCEQFVEVDLPKDQITGKAVFKDARTIDAALRNIYAELRDNAFTTGNGNGVSLLIGMYADELELKSSSMARLLNFEQNNVLPTDSFVKDYWSKGYSLIYSVNLIIEGIESNRGSLVGGVEYLLGEAYFLRAYLHFYLVNLFGPIPYIDSTNYNENRAVYRDNIEIIYQYMVEDLGIARNLLLLVDRPESRLRPDFWVVTAMLARIYLYQENWGLAAMEAENLISNGGFELTEELDEVFLKHSIGTIWQFDPEAEGRNTHEGFFFIENVPPPDFIVSQSLMNSFEVGDARRTHWIGSLTDEINEWFFPFKYKQKSNTETTQECSIMFRLAEQYLIAAEAHAEMGNIAEALEYLNPIRQRAMLPPLDITSKQDLVDAIIHERRIEFFTELGHRFFDLKRKGMATTILSVSKPNWDTTDVLLPLPESELSINPNLLPQNDGY